MADLLEKSGLFFDELNKIRVLDPQVSNKTVELKEECKIFMEKIDEFQKIADIFLQLIAKLATEVEKQKSKAVGSKNLLQSMDKHKQVCQQQLQALVIEKSMELERLKIRHNSLQKAEIEQQEIIDNLGNF